MVDETPQDTLPVEESMSSPHAATTAPTLDDAFFALGRALLPLLEENVPLQMHVQETLGVYADGNVVVGWQRLVLVLEGVLGTPLVVR